MLINAVFIAQRVIKFCFICDQASGKILKNDPLSARKFFFLCLVAKLLPFSNSIFRQSWKQIGFFFALNDATKKINPLLTESVRESELWSLPSRLFLATSLENAIFFSWKLFFFLLTYFAFVQIAQSHNKTRFWIGYTFFAVVCSKYLSP